MTAAAAHGRAYFFEMPDDEELLRQALERSPDDLEAELMRSLFRLRADKVRAEEKGDAATAEQKQSEIEATMRALARVRRMTPTPR